MRSHARRSDLAILRKNKGDLSPNHIFMFSPIFRYFHTPVLEYIYFLFYFFLQHFINDHRNAFCNNCIPENDAVRNTINWLCSLNSFWVTLLPIAVNVQVTFTQRHFIDAKSIQ